jgi:TonB family protein
MTEAEYLALIMRRLEEKKVYPLSVRKRGIEGDVVLAFTIGPDGTLRNLNTGDGHRFLVQAALETARTAAPFPVIEGQDGDFNVQVTLRYQLEDKS